MNEDLGRHELPPRVREIFEDANRRAELSAKITATKSSPILFFLRVCLRPSPDLVRPAMRIFRIGRLLPHWSRPRFRRIPRRRQWFESRRRQRNSDDASRPLSDRRVAKSGPEIIQRFGGDNFVYKCAEESEDDPEFQIMVETVNDWFFPPTADKACGEKSAACQ